MRLCLLGDAGSIHLQRWAGYFSAAGEVSPARLYLLAGGKGAGSGDPGALAKALIRALQDPDLRRKAMTINREKISRRAIWENNMAEISSLYAGLLRQKRTSGTT